MTFYSEARDFRATSELFVTRPARMTGSTTRKRRLRRTARDDLGRKLVLRQGRSMPRAGAIENIARGVMTARRNAEA
jgi:hypothetical protein